MKKNPGYIIVHVWAKKLNSEVNTEPTEKSITDFVKSLANNKRKITIYGIIPRNDEWSNKASKVDYQLKKIGQNSGIYFFESPHPS